MLGLPLVKRPGRLDTSGQSRASSISGGIFMGFYMLGYPTIQLVEKPTMYENHRDFPAIHERTIPTAPLQTPRPFDCLWVRVFWGSGLFTPSQTRFGAHLGMETPMVWANYPKSFESKKNHHHGFSISKTPFKHHETIQRTWGPPKGPQARSSLGHAAHAEAAVHKALGRRRLRAGCREDFMVIFHGDLWWFSMVIYGDFPWWFMVILWLFIGILWWFIGITINFSKTFAPHERRQGSKTTTTCIQSAATRRLKSIGIQCSWLIIINGISWGFP